MKEKKKILVTRASLPPIEEYEDMLKKLWETHWLTNMGEYHERFKEELSAYLHVPGIELFVNGHIALEMAIQAFSLTGEVITTPFTFASTAHAIKRNGLKPVFCDIKEDDATLDPEKLEALITERTSAIVPVHVYGNLCDDDAISRIAEKYGLKVIYDAAHAFGESFLKQDGSGGTARVYAGELGDASMFSFHATKVFHSIEGGAVSWKKKESAFLSDRLYKLKNFGIMGKERVEYVGGNGKMNEFSAAMGLCNLRHVEEWIESRKAVTERYRENLSGVRGLRFLKRRAEVSYNYAYLPVCVSGGIAKRDAVYEALCREGVFPRKYFYPCVNAYDCYRDQYDAMDTPVAKTLSESVLTLPIYPELSSSEVDEICGLLTAALRD